MKKLNPFNIGGGGINLQLFALAYNKVDNPYNFILNKKTYAKGGIKKTYNLYNYCYNIPNHNTVTTIPEENLNYIKEALPNVTDCDFMLYTCERLTSIDTTGWDTSNITSMNGMFYDCNSLTTLDVSKWDTSKVTSMNLMFDNCASLTTLDVSKWNTSKVTDMNSMFYFCYSLTALDISNWDTSNVTDMNSMFMDCESLTTITGVIDMKSCTNYGDMFYDCPKLTGVKIKNPPSGFDGAGLTSSQYTIVS